MLGGLIISFCSGAIGFGASQVTLKDRLATHEADLRVVEAKAAEVKSEVDAWRNTLTILLEKVIDGQSKVIEQNTRIIVLIESNKSSGRGDSR